MVKCNFLEAFRIKLVRCWAPSNEISALITCVFLEMLWPVYWGSKIWSLDLSWRWDGLLKCVWWMIKLNCTSHCLGHKMLWNGMMWWNYWEAKFDHLICPGGDEMAAWDSVKLVKFSRPTNSGTEKMVYSNVNLMESLWWFLRWWNIVLSCV